MAERKFTDAIINKIFSINRQICLIKDLVRKEGGAWLTHYRTTGGQEGKPICAGSVGDYGIEYTIRYSLGKNDPDYDRHNEYANRIAVQNEHIDMTKSDREDSFSELNRNEYVPMIGKLKDTWFDYGFHDLFEHELNANWDLLLRIGEIWLELLFERQNMMNWDDKPLPNHAMQASTDSIYLKNSQYRKRPILQDNDIAYARLIDDKLVAG